MTSLFRLFVIGIVLLIGTPAYADFTIDKLRLSQTQISGVNVTVAAYFKVCFILGTKGVKVTTYYGDDAGTTGRVELSSRSYTTQQSCIDDGISLTFGNTIVKGARFVHVKFEQTGGPTKWDKASINVLGDPNINYLGVPTLSATTADIGDQLTVSFRLKNNGVTKSNVTSEVKILYSFVANDVIDPQKAKRFADAAVVPKINALSNQSTTQVDLKFNVPTPDINPSGSPYQRLYIAVFIDPDSKLIESSRGDNYKTFTVNYRLPDIAVTNVSVSPDPVSGAYANGKPTGTFQVSVTLKNNGPGTFSGEKVNCEALWFDKINITNPVTLALTPLSPPTIASGATWTGSVGGTVPLNAAGGTMGIRCTVENTRKLDTKPANNVLEKATFTLAKWHDYGLSNLALSPTSIQAGKQLSVSFVMKHEGNNETNPTLSLTLISIGGLQQTSLLQNVKPAFTRYGSKSLQLTATIPATLPKGAYLLVLDIDSASNANDAVRQNDSLSRNIVVVVDKDKDGFTNDVDCNDNNKNVNPQATEACDGIDNNCNKQIDEGCACVQGTTRDCYTGGAGCSQNTQTGKYTCTSPCKTGTQVCTGGQWSACVGEVKETPEVCDGKDNDCDGFIDFALPPVPCYTGPSNTKDVGECKSGVKTCTNGTLSACMNEVLPKTELCDGKDNDCDGQTDEDFVTKGAPCEVGVGGCIRKGVFVCAQGGAKLECSAKPAPPQIEMCDGIDNDCDGQVDNIAPKACYTGAPGTRGKLPCKDGKEVCEKGKLVCRGEVLPKAETCNNLDDNCDGQIDENITEDCYTGPAGTKDVGVCSSGTKRCNAGKFGACTGEVLPKAESCNGADDNCNGQVDDGVSRACYTGPAGTKDKGTCRAGVELCVGGRFSGVCAGEVQPVTESCDGKDNDCNGQVDDSPGCVKPAEEPATEPSAEPMTEAITTEPMSEPPQDKTLDAGTEPKTEPLSPDAPGEPAPTPDIQKEAKADAQVPGVGCMSGTPSPGLPSFLFLVALMLFLRRRRAYCK
jgi:hypothetical protein